MDILFSWLLARVQDIMNIIMASHMHESIDEDETDFRDYILGASDTKGK
jgi:hypothetical protein